MLYKYRQSLYMLIRSQEENDKYQEEEEDMATTSFWSSLVPPQRRNPPALILANQRIIGSSGGRRGVCNLRGLRAVAPTPSSVPVRVALELLQAGHRYLDVRTPEEFSAGHAPGAVNVPYMYRTGSGMTNNPHFLAQVSSLFRKDDEIIVGCQSGKRSNMAATDLLATGFYCVTDVAGGHDVWIHNSLPLEF